MVYTNKFTGHSSNPVKQSSRAVQSSDPVHNPVQRLDMFFSITINEVQSISKSRPSNVTQYSARDYFLYNY